MNNELKEVIELAVTTVLSRGADIDMEDGSFATVDADVIIRLEIAISNAFDLPYDDVNESDIPLILSKLKR